jgi:hypothetical protein
LYNDFFKKHLSIPCILNVVSEDIYKELLVFPNPATNEIKIDFPMTGNFRVEIITNSGITALKSMNQNTIDISELKSGIYFIKLISSEKIYMQKVVKQ